MSEAFWIVRRLAKMHPDRLWTLRELAVEAGLDLIATKIAAERLIAHGELIHQGDEHYRRPVDGE
jgi:hypothetical protein